MSRADNQTTIWQVDAVNELGLPTLIRQGDNTLNTTYTYDNYYHLTGISNYRQNDTYVWDVNNGNLSSRSNHIKNLTETFEYDDLNRLTEIRLNNVLVKEMSYASNGNIETKTDAGEYLYDPVMVHAVKQIEGDENTAISGAPQEVAYTAFNKIKTIVEKTTNGDSLVYLYGPDMQRNRMELYDSSNLLKSRVYDGLYETETRENDLIEYCYIEGGNGITAVMMSKGINNTMYYLLRDQQGSITGLVDNQRNLVEEYSYDAWGRRRNPDTWRYDNTPVPQFMFRGYTMHEMLDEFALINMNGRCYDPVVGRFLSPDIVIQDGNNTQCYNKYSYCVNNPLKYTDPSGWTSIGWGQWNDRLAALNDALWKESNERYVGMKDLFHKMVIGQFMAYLETLKGGGGTRAGNSLNAIGESAVGNSQVLFNSEAAPGANPPAGPHCWVDYVNNGVINGDPNAVPVTLGESNTPYQLPVTMLPGIEVISKEISAPTYSALQDAVMAELGTSNEKYRLNSSMMLSATIAGAQGFLGLVKSDDILISEFKGFTNTCKIVTGLSYAYSLNDVRASTIQYIESKDAFYGAKAINQLGIFFTGLIPEGGPLINLVLTSIDYDGGFNNMYNYVSKQQFFWKNFGFMILPTGKVLIK